MNDDDLRELYRGTLEADLEVDVDALRRDAVRFERTIRRRNLVEVFAAGLVVAVFGAGAVARGPDGAGLGLALVALGGLVIAAVIVLRGEGPRPRPGESTARFLDGYREEMLYQARLLRWVPLWYLGPFVPGMALFFGSRLRSGAPGPTLATAVFVALVFAGVAALNLATARRLERSAEAIPRLQG